MTAQDASLSPLTEKQWYADDLDFAYPLLAEWFCGERIDRTAEARQVDNKPAQLDNGVITLDARLLWCE